MARPLSEFLDAVDRDLRKAVVLRGVAWTLVALLGGFFVAGGIDYQLRADSAIARWLLTALAFGPSLLVAALFLVWPLARRPNHLALAQWLEESDEQWRGELKSATAFLQANSMAGSVAIQNRLIDDVEQKLRRTSPHAIVNWRYVRRTLLSLSVAVLGIFGAAFLFPNSAQVMVLRLTQPGMAIEWPRRVVLELVDASGQPLPESFDLGQGQAYQFYVTNRQGALPEDVTLEVERPSGRTLREILPTVEPPSGTSTNDLVGLATFLADEGPLKFRVTGGDDRQMDFRTANVVVPPRIENLVVTVTPPAYLKQPPRTFPAGATRVRGLLGSTVRVEARANKPLRSVDLFVGDSPGPAPEILDDPQRFVATFPLRTERASSYWFRLRDRSGFASLHAPRYEISTQIDMPPEVVLLQPGGDLTATPTATLPIIFQATDDHGLVDAKIRFAVDGPLPDPLSADSQPNPQVIPLLEGETNPPELTQPFDWPLERLGLSVGADLVFRGEASDAFDFGPRRVGTSSPRSVTIVSPEAKQNELGDRQAFLLGELSEAHRVVARIQSATSNLARRFQEANESDVTQHDELSRVEIDFQRMTRRLVGPEESSEVKTSELLRELNSNNIADPLLSARLEQVAKDLQSFREDALARATRNLTNARKAADADEVRGALESVDEQLERVEQGLAELLDEMGTWRDRREILSELRDLEASQTAIAEETVAVAGQVLGTSLAQLSSRQSDQIRSLGTRQSELGERLDRLNKALQPAEGGEEVEVDEQLRAVGERLREMGLVTTARSAGEAIRQNRLGEAGPFQSTILSTLDEMKTLLSQEGSGESPGESLRRLGEQVGSLRAAQQEVLETLRKRMEENEPNNAAGDHEILRRQETLRKETNSAARRGERAQAEQATAQLNRATEAMSQGLEQLRREEPRTAETAMAEALSALDDAEKAISQALGSEEGGLASPAVGTTIDELTSTANRQQRLNEEIRRLDTLKSERGSLSRSQLLTLRDTEQGQAELVKEIAKLRDSITDSPVVLLALDFATMRMQDVVAGLNQRETGEATQRSGERAENRLREIVTSITATDGDKPEASEAAETPENGTPSGPAISPLAQLRLLHAIQVDLRQRTIDWERRGSQGALDADQKREIESLGHELAAIQKLLDELLPMPDGSNTVPGSSPEAEAAERQEP